MNKDALLATIIGFGVGLLITGIVFVGPNILKQMPNMKFPSFSLPKSVTQKTPSKNTTQGTTVAPGTFTIDSPLPESIQSTEEILISGKTVGGATVVVQGETDDVATVASDKGAWAVTVTLAEGKNELTATSYGKDTPESLSVLVYYTPEKF